MTDIKLKPDCELEKALGRLIKAVRECPASIPPGNLDEFEMAALRSADAELTEARAGLLVVIRDGNERSAKHGDEEDCRERGAYRAIANESMGVVIPRKKEVEHEQSQ